MKSNPDTVKVNHIEQPFSWFYNAAYENYASIVGLQGWGLYTSLCRYASHGSRECFPSVKTLAEKFSVNERTIRRLLEILEKNGLISIERKIGRSSIITILSPFAQSDDKTPVQNVHTLTVDKLDTPVQNVRGTTVQNVQGGADISDPLKRTNRKRTNEKDPSLSSDHGSSSSGHPSYEKKRESFSSHDLTLDFQQEARTPQKDDSHVPPQRDKTSPQKGNAPTTQKKGHNLEAIKHVRAKWGFPSEHHPSYEKKAAIIDSIVADCGMIGLVHAMEMHEATYTHMETRSISHLYENLNELLKAYENKQKSDTPKVRRPVCLVTYPRQSRIQQAPDGEYTGLRDDDI